MSDYGVGALGGVVLIDPDTGLPYKASGGGGGATNEIKNSDNSVTATAQEDEIFRAQVTTTNGQGILRILDVGGVLSCLLTDEGGNPLLSGWSPAGVVVHAELDLKQDAPTTGTPSTTTYLRGDGSWATPTNTTYTAATQVEIENPASTTARLVTGQRLSQGVTANLTAITGFDPGESQTLKNVAGALTWVTDE